MKQKRLRGPELTVLETRFESELSEGNRRVPALLEEALKPEQTDINYILSALRRSWESWRQKKLARDVRQASIQELTHAESLKERTV
jgi:bacterioferritin (cytochrome b1)